MPTTDLILALPVAAVKFRLDFGQEISGKGTGAIQVADLRPARWVVQVSGGEIELAAHAAIQAMVEDLDGSIETFLMFDPAKQYPTLDPTGSIVGASAVKIKSVGVDGKSFALKTLPVGYTLSRGDLIEVQYGAPLHYALHRVIPATVVANGSGETAEFEVRPRVVTGMAIDNVVNLKRPCAEFRLIPGTYDPSAVDLRGTFSFQAAQRI